MAQKVTRRGFLGSAGAVASTLGGLATGTPGAAAATDPPPAPIVRGDGRYETLSQGFNQRWTSDPSYIQLITGDTDALTAVGEALERRLRPTVRSGGHCYEDFVANDGGAILDISPMNGVRKGTDKYGNTAYCVEAGATNWDMYTTLFRRYDVTVPGGSCYSVGAGGHIVGGGYGLLSRRHGLTVDHLVQVDVVTLRNGGPEVTSAHRDDPAGSDTAELFWAHTGAGGGNFGVILRYWFAADLPKPPPRVWLSSVAWKWSELRQRPEDLTRLLRNYGEFFAAHSAADEPTYQGLFTLLKLTHHSNDNVVLLAQWDGEEVGPLDRFLGAVEAGMRTRATVQTGSVGGLFLPYPDKRRQLPWFQATMTLNGSGDNQRGKYKSAYHRRPFTEHQITAICHWLTHDVPDVDLSQTLLQVDSYGCRINAVAPADTAVPQRDSILKLQYQTYWTNPADDPAHLGFLQDFYRDVYRDAGGVPGLDGDTDGAYVNYPDTDLGVATDPDPDYPRLYYKAGYPRLQAAKKTWDPENVFHHKQSIVPPG
ncbi:FAD/FMN-containing dehydrogenase [Kitasatospora gansuensis]|uniref:FAD/FMN-containing dehydrogenase n=1 Tax=Kitasatospora gansuensis TaxID=258050 RepID=A0A7W7WLM4_9ACTN|nr:BBE domain-containing protein [Kitasatospora gansuensis]MBB4951601.1 FAD/FMN-containing dehydrogenase [Kitasatospora gansuensis]